MTDLLSIDGLSLSIDGRPILRGVRFGVGTGETVCLVGESGSGKSLTCLSALRLPPPGGRIDGGAVRFDGRDVLDLGAPDLRRLRGHGIGIIFQDAMGALNPIYTVGRQIAESLALHRGLHGAAAKAEIERLLRAVGLPDPWRVAGSHPHQLSGGMCQRSMIAMALAGNPRLLIADEPTTALDVTVQAQILDLLRDLKRERGMALLLVTHDLGVAAEMADRIVVMRHGEVVEDGPVHEIFDRPRHPYTRSLLDAVAAFDRGPVPLPL